jgi:hypothetical protein
MKALPRADLAAAAAGFERGNSPRRALALRARHEKTRCGAVSI